MPRIRLILPVLLIAFMFGMTQLAEASNLANVRNGAPCQVRIQVASNNGTLYPELSIPVGGTYTVKLLTNAETVARIKINGIWYVAPYGAACIPLSTTCPTRLCYLGGQDWVVY